MHSTTSSRSAFTSTSSSVFSNSSSTSMGDTMNKQMYTAVLQQNTAALNAAIADGADIDFQHESYGPGNTALIGACFNGFVEGVQTLIEHGADLDVVNSYHESGLIYTASHGTTEVAKMLLDHGADVTILADNGESAEDRAVRNGHNEIAALINAAVKRRSDKIALEAKQSEEARLYLERLSDIELFLKKIDVYERVWPTLQQEAIMDMKTLGQLSQQDFRSIGILLGDVVRIGRGLAERDTM
eukprot:m.98701 g.98701  ORF g.98701 m.98701 type:complete len:243 (-) comp27090_c0_seq1:446-1174(-)